MTYQNTKIRLADDLQASEDIDAISATNSIMLFSWLRFHFLSAWHAPRLDLSCLSARINNMAEQVQHISSSTHRLATSA